MSQEKEPATITEQTCFVMLFVLLFLSAGFSFATSQRLEELNDKIMVRDSMILHMEQHHHWKDSVMFDYMDKWFDKLHQR